LFTNLFFSICFAAFMPKETFGEKLPDSTKIENRELYLSRRPADAPLPERHFHFYLAERCLRFLEMGYYANRKRG
jgi:hypothetical protein